MKTSKIFVTGIGTEIGKTVVSAILTEALKADYWKPIQAGDLDFTDTMKVKSWVSHSNFNYFPEAYRLTHPMSPHAAAEKDNIEIDCQSIALPQSERPLVIEGAGGLMVPLNQHECIIDLIEKLKISVVLVCQNYLGSINHSLLSIEALLRRSIPIVGIIFNGAETPSTEDIIIKKSGLPHIASLRPQPQITSELVSHIAKQWQPSLENTLPR